MLNYVWLALIVIGILVALGSDMRDLSTNKFHNGEEIEATLHFPPHVYLRSYEPQWYPPRSLKYGQKYPISL